MSKIIFLIKAALYLFLLYNNRNLFIHQHIIDILAVFWVKRNNEALTI